MKFSAKFAHGTRNKLEHFENVVGNPLNPISIFIFPGSVFVSNVMQKQVNGFLLNFHKMSGSTHVMIT